MLDRESELYHSGLLARETQKSNGSDRSSEKGGRERERARTEKDRERDRDPDRAWSEGPAHGEPASGVQRAEIASA